MFEGNAYGTGLDRSRVAAINAARTILAELAQEASRLAWHADARPLVGTPNPQDYGRLAEAAEVAEHALFHVLNVASSHVGVKLTGTELHNNPPAPEPEPELDLKREHRRHVADLMRAENTQRTVNGITPEEATAELNALERRASIARETS